MTTMLAMGLVFLALSWAAVVASHAYAEADRELQADALMFAAVPLSILAVLALLTNLLLEVTP